MIVKDMLEREVQIPDELRIVSLVPSQTELLYDLGLENEVMGITNYCIHPKEWRASKTTVGGTKYINIEKIKDLKPTLIIGNKEENIQEDIEELSKICSVWLSDVPDFNSAIMMIQKIASITNKTQKGNEIIEKINFEFNQFQLHLKREAIYLIWKDPYMTIGGDTFISSMMQKAGFINLFKANKRYPEINLEIIKNIAPKYLLLSSEPYPFKEKHLIEFQNLYPNTKVIIVDGEMFSWYGSRMIKSAKYFQKIV